VEVFEDVTNNDEKMFKKVSKKVQLFLLKYIG